MSRVASTSRCAQVAPARPCKRGESRHLLVAALLLGAAGCAPQPEKISDRFVDLYFVEIDQARALALCSGPAQKKLEDELRLVEDVRRTYTPEQAKPAIYYERQSFRSDGDQARASYEVRIKQGADETRRQVLVTLSLVAGKWTVSNFTVQEGLSPPRPPA